MSSGAPSHGYALRSRGSPLKINNIYTINNNNNNNKSIEHNVDVKEPKKKEKVPGMNFLFGLSSIRISFFFYN